MFNYYKENYQKEIEAIEKVINSNYRDISWWLDQIDIPGLVSDIIDTHIDYEIDFTPAAINDTLYEFYYNDDNVCSVESGYGNYSHPVYF